MADNVANVDIEDVLSSIRRLVSDESTPRKVVSVDHAPAKPAPKLVLTPALRIIPEAAGFPDQVPDKGRTGSAAFEDTGASSDAALSALESTIAALETAVGGQIGDWEPDGSENEPILDPPPAMFKSSISEPEDDPREEDPEAKAEAPLASDPATDAAKHSARRLNLSVPRDEPGASPEPAGKGVAAAPPPVAKPSSAPLIVGAAEAVGGAADFEIADKAPPEAETTESGAEQVATASAPETVASPAPAAEADEDTEEVLLDEETLRTMIATVVRDELRGAFGEEITRNLRKLIRREIHAYFDVGEGK